MIRRWEKKKKQKHVGKGLNLDVHTHPVFHSFGSVCSFFLSVVVREDVDDSHEVYLLLHGACRKNRTSQVNSTLLLLLP